MASSHWPSSPPFIVRPSSLGKRGISFSHLRRPSVATASTTEPVAVQYTPEQRKILTRAHDSAGSRAISPMSSIKQQSPPIRTLPKAVASPVVPRVRVRKPESPSKYIQSEARKVSTELEKVMEEAFNRTSMSSSIRSMVTDPHKDASEYETPPTSFSNRDSGGSAFATPNTKTILQNRPLPPIPQETPNTFLHRKLAETRAEIARRLDQGGDNTEHFNEVLEHLDRLMMPKVNGGKRTSSAPAHSPEHPAPLHVIPEEGRADGEDRFEPYSPSYRVVTDPLRPNLRDRRAVTEHTTIRLVDQSPTHVAPLNIRKRSGASTATRYAIDDSTLQCSDQPCLAPVRPYQAVQDDLLAARPKENIANNVATLSIPEKKEATIKKKKSWFRRTPEEKEHPQENHKKPSTGLLQIPEAWQSLDDRIKNEPTSVVEPNVDITKHTTKHSDGSTSSEFPMRRCGTAIGKSEGNGALKGFFGLFGKKMKEDKTNRPMELGCELSYLHLYSHDVRHIVPFTNTLRSRQF